ncbi:MAG: hypothetical protein ACREEB_16435 [Caulobacteraceae bacterium]
MNWSEAVMSREVGAPEPRSAVDAMWNFERVKGVVADTVAEWIAEGRARAVKRARATSRKIIAGREGFTVDDFLAERRRDAEREG